MTKKERIAEIVNNLPIAEKIRVWNEYCYADADYDGIIDENTEEHINDILYGVSPYDIAYIVEDTWHRHDDYVVEHNGSLVSFTEYDLDEHIFATDVATYCLLDGNSFGIDEIQEIIDEEENENG